MPDLIERPNPQIPSNEELTRLGILTPEALSKHAEDEPEWLVKDLIQTRSMNLLVGDSGIGKTPLLVQLGVCVAAGIPFLGRPTRQGIVLYADFESSAAGFAGIVKSVSSFEELKEPPPHFLTWSPEWKKPTTDNYLDQLLMRVDRVNPDLVLVDPLRLFAPDAPVKNEDTAKLFKRLRRNGTRAAWLFCHHNRKTPNGDQMFDTSLVEQPKLWLQKASGALALVNHTDTRLGVNETEAIKGSDLAMSGFVRGKETLQAMFLVRQEDENGEPIGYRLFKSLDRLKTEHRLAFKSLQERFTWREVKIALKTDSGSVAQAFIKKLQSAGMIKKVDEGKGLYEKIY